MGWDGFNFHTIHTFSEGQKAKIFMVHGPWKDTLSSAKQPYFPRTPGS